MSVLTLHIQSKLKAYRVGDAVTEGGFRIEVTAMATRHPQRCRILPPQETDEEMADPT